MRWTGPVRDIVSWVAVPALLAGGCTGPTDPPPPPGGGRVYTLDFDEFAAAVAPVFTQRGCDAGGDCHGGGIRGTFELSPVSDKDLNFDFAQASLQVNGDDPASSPLLRKPLAEAAGGSPHAVSPFASTADPDYQAILTWIEHGEFP